MPSSLVADIRSPLAVFPESPLSKRQLTGLALRELAAFIESAPNFPRSDEPYTVDDLVCALVEGTDTGRFMMMLERDPTAIDGHVDYCAYCHGDHDSNCPVGMLEWLAEHGVDSPVPVPPNMGVRGVR